MAKVKDLFQSQKFLVFEIVLLFILIIFSVSLYLRPEEIRKLKDQADLACRQNDLQTCYRLINQALFLSPGDSSLHQRLALVYQKTNNWSQAERELKLAKQIDPTNKKVAADLLVTQKVLAEPVIIKSKIRNWEKEVKNKPDYRDAWLQLAANYYQIYQVDKAKLALNHAWQIDPNFEPTKKFLEIVK